MLRRYGVLWLVAAGVFVLSPAPQYLIDMVFYPWAHADPPLLDRWVGRATAGNGDRLDLVLVLERTPESPDGGICATCNQVEGTAVTCDARGFNANFFWRRGKSGISSTDDPATQPVPVRLRRAGPLGPAQRQQSASEPAHQGSPAPACGSARRDS